NEGESNFQTVGWGSARSDVHARLENRGQTPISQGIRQHTMKSGSDPDFLTGHLFPSIKTKAIRAVFWERLAQAWLVPRWMRTSPARISVSPSSITDQISPSSRIA